MTTHHATIVDTGLVEAGSPAGAVDRAATPSSNGTLAGGGSWLQFNRHRVAIRQRWPHLFDLDIVGSFFDLFDRHGIAPTRLLDVGATDRVWEQTIRQRWPGCAYRSLDIDRTNRHDYYEFSAVDELFDAVVCFEVLEHVPQGVGLEIVRDCAAVCRPGGVVLCSVPNVTMPIHQLQFPHISAINHRDLGALLRQQGLVVLDITRVFFGSTRRRWMHRALLGPLHRAMQIDYCQSIAALARKPGPDEESP